MPAGTQPPTLAADKIPSSRPEHLQQRVTKPAPNIWLSALTVMGIMYCILNTSILEWVDVDIHYFVIIPILWIVIGFIGWRGWKYGLEEKPRFTALLFQLSFLGGLAQVTALIIAGLMTGFGKSPYAHQFPQVLGNLFYIIAYLAGFEMMRGYLLMRGASRRPLLFFVLITLGFTLFTFPVGLYSLLGDPSTFFPTLGRVILPRFAENLLSTYLVWVGGPLAALTYRLIITLFEWLMPVLPDISWMLQALIGTLLPTLILIFVNQALAGREVITPLENKTDEKKKSQSILWLIVSILIVLLVWFNTGVFGIRHYLVSGVSMNPALYAGDIAIVKSVAPEEVKVGDVIMFYTSNSNRVLHRVIAIDNVNGKIEFITRGDNLNVTDDPVTLDRFAGKMTLVIPKIGWISIGIRRLLEWD
ncbi:MAG: signal peptidase I [Chloroflexi bacterium]|nr:signal peptidase I [Chloroflexota bacterium]